MKSSQKILIILALVFCFPQLVFAQDEYWEIQKFHSDITILENGKIAISENIIADFANEAHRGIARNIPYRYRDGITNYKADLSFISATDENLLPWDTRTYNENGYLNIEMRNRENQPNNEQNTFIVNYEAKNVIQFFETHEEFYWNVNGSEWPVPMAEVSASIHLPKDFKQDDIKLQCYTGSFASEEENCSWEMGKLARTITFRTNGPLDRYENLTVVVGMPAGTIEKPSNFDKIISFLKANWPIAIPFITLIVLLIAWYKKGRDEASTRTTIMPHYRPPDDLSPSETGIIIDEKMDPRDITATIIDYAIKGHLKIKEIKEKKFFVNNTDYELELIKDYPKAKNFEKIILDFIFRNGKKTRISDLKNEFYKKIKEVEKAAYGDLVAQNYFPYNPNTVRNIFYIVGAIIAFSLPGIAAGITQSPIAFAAIIFTGLIIMAFGKIMPRKTQKGSETYYVLKGLQEYINTAEKDRMKFQEEQNILFEKLLPYAMAFGLIKKWTKAFEGILSAPPKWFTGYNAMDFNMNAFADSMNNFGHDFTENIRSRPGGKGGGSGFSGGFSGGGFGGGGGRGL